MTNKHGKKEILFEKRNYYLRDGFFDHFCFWHFKLVFLIFLFINCTGRRIKLRTDGTEIKCHY
jgi:hypothetical protein